MVSKSYNLKKFFTDSTTRVKQSSNLSRVAKNNASISSCNGDIHTYDYLGPMMLG